jgi:hypothetical protein
VLVWSGRAENELAIGQRFEFDRFARRLESREVPAPPFVRCRKDARCDGDREDGAARRGLVTPALAGLQTYRKIVDRRGGRDGARCGPVAAKEDARRTVFRHIARGLVHAYGRTQFEFRRQGDPELEAARPSCFVEPAVVPHAAPSLHPFDAAGRQWALHVVRVDIANRAFRDVGSRAIGVPLKIAWELEPSPRSGGQDAMARAVFKAAVHHSRSSISAPAGASSSASPASTSPPR